MPQSEPVRIAIIGAGIAAGEIHLPVYLSLGRLFKVVTVCSRTVDKARAIAGKLGCRYSTDYDRVLSDPGIEAVDLCLPIEMNYPAALKAAEAGKHIICEKPIGTSREEIEAMAALPEKHGVRLMIAENYRYRKPFIIGRKLIREGAIGRPHLFIYNHLSGRREAQTAWRTSHKYPGGFLLDGGVHYVNALRLLGGEIASVKAYVSSANPLLGKVDTATVSLRFASGALGSLVMGYASQPITGPTYIAAGFKGTLKITDRSISLWEKRKRKAAWKVRDDGGFTAEFRDFFRLVRLGKAADMSTDDARRDALTILAALESAETGREVFPVR